MAKPPLFFKIIIILLFLALAAQGQQLQRVAIMGTEDDGEPPIKILEASYLTDKLREVAGKTLPKNSYGIMTQQSIVDRLGSEERAVKECKEATCLADLGRKINADYIAQARIGRFGEDLTIKVELYRVASGHLIASFTEISKTVHGLLAVLEAKAPDLFKDLSVLATPVAPTPAPAAPPPVTPAPVHFPASVAAEAVENVVEEEVKEEKVEKKGVRFGARAGFNMYKYSEHDFNPDMGMGGGVGVAVKIPLSSRLSVYSGLDFYYRGLYENYNYSFNYNNFYEYNYEYYDMYEYALSVPVLIQFALTESFYLAVGVYLDFPLAATEVTLTETAIEEDQDVTEFRKACDFGLALELGYMITPNFGIDLRGAMGMTSLFEYEGYKYGSLMQFGIGITYYFF